MSKHSNNMIRTPGGINIGVPFYKDDGTYYIEMKQGKKCEEVPLEFISANVHKKAVRKAEIPLNEKLA